MLRIPRFVTTAKKRLLAADYQLVADHYDFANTRYERVSEFGPSRAKLNARTPIWTPLAPDSAVSGPSHWVLDSTEEDEQTKSTPFQFNACDAICRSDRDAFASQ